ncbi:MAG: hypothetical protein NVSMB22_01850 [Chloroflexota bacterium]
METNPVRKDLSVDIIAQSVHTVERHISPISRLQGDAWAAWNASYSAEDREIYQSVSRSLYQQDVRERIVSLFARSDEQNRRLDASMTGHARNRAGRKRPTSALADRPAAKIG